MKLRISHDRAVNFLILGGFTAFLAGLYFVYWPLPLVAGGLACGGVGVYAAFRERET